mmetsp:Transcript_26088/g.56981  ORF Transcript_26088/g.56981 Transcript_26088/m.56981 type:complete len:81 (-) Transcript_26088:2439-2681(-)
MVWNQHDVASHPHIVIELYATPIHAIHAEVLQCLTTMHVPLPTQLTYRTMLSKQKTQPHMQPTSAGLNSPPPWSHFSHIS